MKNCAVLSIGGFDPTCLAGIVRDSITFRNLGVAHVTLISGVTSQNSKELSSIYVISEKIFKDQFEKLLEDFNPKVIKTGMLPACYQIDLIVDFVEKKSLKLVVDPLKKTSSGGELVKQDVYNYLIEKLLPISSVVTPNIPEAEYMTSLKIKNENDMIRAAKSIQQDNSFAVYLKGGHLEGKPIDILSSDDSITVFESTRNPNNLRGTGCIFASSISSFLFKGDDILVACSKSKKYIDMVIKDPGKFYP